MKLNSELQYMICLALNETVSFLIWVWFTPQNSNTQNLRNRTVDTTHVINNLIVERRYAPHDKTSGWWELAPSLLSVVVKCAEWVSSIKLYLNLMTAHLWVLEILKRENCSAKLWRFSTNDTQTPLIKCLQNWTRNRRVTFNLDVWELFTKCWNSASVVRITMYLPFSYFLFSACTESFFPLL